MTRKDDMLAKFNTTFGDRADNHYLLGVFGQVITEHDPTRDMPQAELLEILARKLESLGYEVQR